MPHDSLANFKLQYEKYREAKKDRTTIHQHYRSLWTKSVDTLTDLSKRTRKVCRVADRTVKVRGNITRVGRRTLERK